MSESPVTSRPVRVTLFEDRAEVVREASVRVPPGGGWVSVLGFTPFIDDRSVQVRVTSGAARVVAARVVRRIVEESALGREAIDALEQELRRAARDVRLASLASDREQARAERARALLGSWAVGLTTAPAGQRSATTAASGTDARDAVVGGWRAAYDAIVCEEADALTGRADAERAKALANDAWRRATVRLDEGRATHLRREATVEIRLDPPAEDAIERDESGEPREPGERAGDVGLAITYRTPGALWRPEHVVRATRRTAPAPTGSAGSTGADAAQVEIVTWATMWQRTGESWTDVEVELSTARPAREATAPLLDDDVLAARKKTDEERQRTIVEAREQRVVQAEAFGGTRAVRAIGEMPGVDDGGVPLRYTPSARTTLRSDGQASRVEIARRVLPAQIDVVVFAELAPVAHVRARGTMPAGGPLLAGPLHVALDGATAGRSRSRFVGAGEPFEIGLGTEDAVRVQREVESEDDVTAVMGTQKRKRTVVVWLWNLSRESKRVKVVERIPVSEIDGLEVTLASPRASGAEGARVQDWTFDRKDGFASREVDLAANGSAKLTLVYEVRAPAKLTLPHF